MVTFKPSRAGITYHYVKRQVLEDGVSTTPLDITLKFWPWACVGVDISGPKATVEVDISGSKAIVRLGDHPIRYDFFINTIIIVVTQ